MMFCHDFQNNRKVSVVLTLQFTWIINNKLIFFRIGNEFFVYNLQIITKRSALFLSRLSERMYKKVVLVN